MENTEKTEKTTEQMALELAQLMEDGKGQDVCVLDISALNSSSNSLDVDHFSVPSVFENHSQKAHIMHLHRYIHIAPNQNFCR